MFNKLDIVARIEKELSAKKIPATRFANDMGGKDRGYSKDTVYSWRKNLSTSYINDLQDIADYLGVSTDYLLTGKETTNQPTLKLVQNPEEEIMDNSRDDHMKEIEETAFFQASIGQRILYLVKDRKDSISKLATALGMSQEALVGWNTGQSEPDDEVLTKFAQLYNVPVDYLKDGYRILAVKRHSQLYFGESVGGSANAYSNYGEEITSQRSHDEKTFDALPLNEKLKALRLEQGLSIRDFVLKELRRDEKFIYDYTKFEENENLHPETALLKPVLDFYGSIIYSFEAYEYRKSLLSLEVCGKRRREGLSQKELADTIGVHEISISSLESGERMPYRDCLERLNAYLGGLDHLATLDKEITKTDNVG